VDSQKGNFQLRRFTLTDGSEVRLYCRLVKAREPVFVTCRLYEDRGGHEWLEIEAGGQAILTPLTDESFEQRVAAEINTLGLNKYSG
jgi:hypothetical protein